jgi:hypothetical protein
MTKVVNLAERKAVSDLQKARQRLVDLAQRDNKATDEERMDAFREYDAAIGRLTNAVWGSAC